MNQPFPFARRLGLFTLMLTATAQAEPVGAPESPPDNAQAMPSSQPPADWYGLPLLALDVMWLSLIALGQASDEKELLVTSVAGSMTNGLMVHTFIYDEDERFKGLAKGLLSCAMRGGLGGAGCKLGPGCSELSDSALLRLSVGVGLGAALDAAFLAFKHPKKGATKAGFSLYPIASSDSIGARLAGRF